MKKTIIFGNSEFAEIVHYYITVDGGWDVAAFTVNQKYITEEKLLGIPVVPYDTIDETFPPDKYFMVIAIGYKDLNKLRQSVYNSAKSKGYDLPSFIHPTNTIALNSVIGESCLVFENNTIQPFVKIGDNVIVWSCNTIGHHSVVEDHCFISSNTLFGGYATIGKRSLLGGCCNISSGHSVGKDCFIGANALVDEDADDGGVYRGQKSERRKIPSSRLKV